PRRRRRAGRIRSPAIPGAAASGAGQDDLPVVLRRAVEHRGVADPLHERRTGAAGQVGNHGVARVAVLAGHLHLDQLVVLQGQVDLGHEGVADALAPHLQHRLEVVGLAAQEAGLGTGEGGGHGGKGRPERAFSQAAQGIMAARMATRSKSSQRWLKEHFSDPYVKKAQAEGMRSRAAYKLEELVARDRLLKPGMVVVDLGAAPGGWSQWVRQALGD